MAINGTSANLGSQAEPWVKLVEKQLADQAAINKALLDRLTILMNRSK